METKKKVRDDRFLFSSAIRSESVIFSHIGLGGDAFGAWKCVKRVCVFVSRLRYHAGCGLAII